MPEIQAATDGAAAICPAHQRRLQMGHGLTLRCEQSEEKVHQ
jgi:hypothetical protein